MLTFFFGCRHANLSWPQTPVNRMRRPTGEPTYVVCLGCSRKFEYDPQNFRQGAEIKAQVDRARQEAEA